MNQDGLHDIHWVSWSRALIRYLNICRRLFEGDLDRFLILAELGRQVHRLQAFATATHASGRVQAPWIELRDAGLNASQISRETSIPRQTVRRKLNWMEERGWIDGFADSRFAISRRSGAELSGVTADLLVPAEEMILAAQPRLGLTAAGLQHGQPRTLLSSSHGTLWPAWADHTLAVLSGARQHFGHDLDRIMLLLTLAQVAAERLGSDALLMRDASVIAAKLESTGSNRLSLSDALAIPRESSRRKIEILVASGVLRTSGLNTVILSQHGLEIYRGFASIAVAEISVFQRQLFEMLTQLKRPDGGHGASAAAINSVVKPSPKA